MSNRINLTLSPCIAAGCLAATPWLLACVFALIAGAAGKHWIYAFTPVALAGAIYQFRLNGLLAGASAVLGLEQDQNTLYAHLGSGQTLAVCASSSSRISSKIALLKLQPLAAKSTCYSVVLLSGKRIAGNIPEDQFRRLRMWLRLGRVQQSFE